MKECKNCGMNDHDSVENCPSCGRVLTNLMPGQDRSADDPMAKVRAQIPGVLSVVGITVAMRYSYYFGYAVCAIAAIWSWFSDRKASRILPTAIVALMTVWIVLAQINR